MATIELPVKVLTLEHISRYIESLMMLSQLRNAEVEIEEWSSEELLINIDKFPLDKSKLDAAAIDHYAEWGADDIDELFIYLGVQNGLLQMGIARELNINTGIPMNEAQFIDFVYDTMVQLQEDCDESGICLSWNPEPKGLYDGLKAGI